MDINIKKILILDDNKEYIVVSKINFENKNYIYLVDIHDNNNFKFAEIESNNQSILEINSSEQELLDKLMPLFYETSIELFKS